jgi:hypothetical protein
MTTSPGIAEDLASCLLGLQVAPERREVQPVLELLEPELLKLVVQWLEAPVGLSVQQQGQQVVLKAPLLELEQWLVTRLCKEGWGDALNPKPTMQTVNHRPRSHSANLPTNNHLKPVSVIKLKETMFGARRSLIHGAKHHKALNQVEQKGADGCRSSGIPSGTAEPLPTAFENPGAPA